MLSLIDCFVVGLALDITGAYLLARALLVSSREIATLGTYSGVEVGAQVNRLKDRVDGEAGIVALLFGFVTQGVGHSLALAGVESETGGGRLLIGITLGILVAGTYLLAWRATRPRRVRRLLVRVVLAREGTGNAGDERRGGWTHTKSQLLVRYGVGAGYPLRAGEAEQPWLYGRRVFDVAMSPEDIAGPRSAGKS